MINGIDLLKFVLAFLVIAIHTNFNQCNIVFETTTGLAVPIFFTISGYLVQKKLEQIDGNETQHYLRKYLTRSVRLYITWCILYLPLTIYGSLHSNDNILIRLFSILRGWVFVGENYMSWPLWYLLALIVATMIIRELLKHRFSTKQIFILSLILYAIGLCVDYIHDIGQGNVYVQKVIGIYYLLFKTTRNGIFLGLCFVSSGMMLARNEDRLKKIFSWEIYPICLLSFILCHYKIPFANVLFSSSFIALVLHSNIHYCKCSTLLRKMSTLIYFTHMFFVAYLQLCKHYYTPFRLFAIASLLCSMSCIMLIWLSHKQSFSFLNKLMS